MHTAAVFFLKSWVLKLSHGEVAIKYIFFCKTTENTGKVGLLSEKCGCIQGSPNLSIATLAVLDYNYVKSAVPDVPQGIGNR